MHWLDCSQPLSSGRNEESSILRVQGAREKQSRVLGLECSQPSAREELAGLEQ